MVDLYIVVGAVIGLILGAAVGGFIIAMYDEKVFRDTERRGRFRRTWFR